MNHIKAELTNRQKLIRRIGPEHTLLLREILIDDKNSLLTDLARVPTFDKIHHIFAVQGKITFIDDILKDIEYLSK